MDETRKAGPPVIIGDDPKPYTEDQIVQCLRFQMMLTVQLCDVYAVAAEAAKNTSLTNFCRSLRDKHEDLSRSSGRDWYGPDVASTWPRF